MPIRRDSPVMSLPATPGRRNLSVLSVSAFPKRVFMPSGQFARARTSTKRRDSEDTELPQAQHLTLFNNLTRSLPENTVKSSRCLRLVVLRHFLQVAHRKHLAPSRRSACHPRRRHLENRPCRRSLHDRRENQAKLDSQDPGSSVGCTAVLASRATPMWWLIRKRSSHNQLRPYQIPKWPITTRFLPVAQRGIRRSSGRQVGQQIDFIWRHPPTKSPGRPNPGHAALRGWTDPPGGTRSVASGLSVPRLLQ